ncbi:MAG: RsmE family RNA methyltransferase [Patescibacteria group bacterium]|nr:RsmE family RNA methyltransferase [Patescibacteria group bacterium]
MKIHRFIDSFDFSRKKIDISGDTAHQMKNVLKLKKSETIILCDGKGMDAVASIAEMGKSSVSVIIDQVRENDAEPKRLVTLYASVLKHDNFDLLIQKATEVGVSEIIPLICDRTVKADIRLDRAMRIAKEAAELAGRGKVPIVRSPSRFTIALGNRDAAAVHHLFDASGSELRQDMTDGSAAAWIGPEGGWSEEELEEAKKAGLKIATLGAQILRGETAAVVASYLLCH